MHLRQKVLLRPQLSPEFLSTIGPNPKPTRKPRPNLQLCAVQYQAKPCTGNEFAETDSASLHPSYSTAPFEAISQWWRTVGKTVFDLSGPRFESFTSRFSDERAFARPTGRHERDIFTCNQKRLKGLTRYAFSHFSFIYLFFIKHSD